MLRLLKLHQPAFLIISGSCNSSACSYRSLEWANSMQIHCYYSSAISDHFYKKWLFRWMDYMNFWPWSISSLTSATFSAVAPHFHGKFTIITLIKGMKYVLCLSILPSSQVLCYKDQFLFIYISRQHIFTFQPWFVSGHLLSVQSDFSLLGGSM